LYLKYLAARNDAKGIEITPIKMAKPITPNLFLVDTINLFFLENFFDGFLFGKYALHFAKIHEPEKKNRKTPKTPPDMVIINVSTKP